MSAVLGRPLVHALVDDEHGRWTINWDTTSAVADQLPPGSHEFTDRWLLNVAANERGIDLSLLLMLMIAAAAAIIGDGRIMDDAKLVGGGELSGGDLLVRAAAGRERSAQEVLAALGSPSWGD